MKLHEAIPHFSETQSEELIAFANDDVLKESRYLFFHNTAVRGTKKVYCTHCRQEFKTDKYLKHNERFVCEKCGSITYAKQTFRGRGKMIDVAYIEFAEPSLVDPEAFTVSGYYVYRDYREGYKNVETGFVRLAMYLFKPGESHMWKRSKWENVEGFNSFIKTRTISSLGRTSMQRVNCFLSRESVSLAVRSTPFKYSQWECYYNARLLEYFALVCKYPIVEVLTKIGLNDIIWQYLNKSWTGGTPFILKWRAKTLDKMIGLPKSDWKQIKHLSKPLKSNDLYAMQELRKHETIPFLELYEIYEKLGGLAAIENMKKLTGLPLRKIYNYARKQFELEKEHFVTIRQAAVTWRDYLLECRRTHVNLAEPSNLFPKNVRQMHQLQNDRKKAIADMKLNLKIRKRVKELTGLKVRSNEFLIKPIESAQELANESNQLVHCVSDYGGRYADGQTTLMVIRKVSEPEKPFYTVELNLKDKTVVQVRGHKNKPATKEVQQFMDKFKGLLQQTPNKSEKARKQA